MAYYPGAGIKKPMNTIQGPMYPEIKRALPRFVDAGKHWAVDTGATTRDLEHLDQILNGAVLAQSRSYNQTVYGQSSSKDVVNKNFRPPLLSQDDFLPLSRQPRKIVVPRINPSGIAASYTPQNERPSGIDSYLTDRIKTGNWRPTFFCPITFPEDSNFVLPDLELTLPGYSANAGLNTLARIDAPPPELELEREHFTLLLDSGSTVPITLDGPVKHPDDLPLNRPTYSTSAGLNSPLLMNAQSPLEHLNPSHNRPVYSASAGLNTPVTVDMQTPLTQLNPKLNRPAVSADAGVNTPIRLDMESVMSQFQPTRNLPEYSVSAGVNVATKIDHETPLSQFQPERTLPVRSVPAGLNVPAKLDMQSSLTQFNPSLNRPTYSADAGVHVPAQIDMPSPEENLELALSRPAYSVAAGINTPAKVDMQTSLTQLNPALNRPTYSAAAGMNTPVQVDMQSPLVTLDPERNLPAYSADAGINNPVQVDMENPLTRLSLLSQIDPEISVNPGSSVYDGQNYTQPIPEQLDKVGHTLPQVSYRVPEQVPVTSLNNRAIPSQFPGMKDIIQPDASSYTSAGHIPQPGVPIPKIQLRAVKIAAQAAGRFRS